MKPFVRAPFFEMSVKNYIYGQPVLDFAKTADRAAQKYDVDVLFIAPYMEIRRIAEQTERVIVLAPYMDLIHPGRGIADVLPEALYEAGARGVLLNHCERPMALTTIKKCIDRANSLNMLSFVCADTLDEAKAVAQLQPDIMNPEPTELIGSGKASDMSYVRDTVTEIKQINPSIYVEQAAGITTAQQIYDFIMAGSDGAGSASGLLQSKNPLELLDEMVHAVAEAKKHRHLI
ncbi:MAG: triose-phosphate isomerase [Clostridia bacterium]